MVLEGGKKWIVRATACVLKRSSLSCDNEPSVDHLGSSVIFRGRSRHKSLEASFAQACARTCTRLAQAARRSGLRPVETFVRSSTLNGVRFFSAFCPAGGALLSRKGDIQTARLAAKAPDNNSNHQCLVQNKVLGMSRSYLLRPQRFETAGTEHRMARGSGVVDGHHSTLFPTDMRH